MLPFGRELDRQAGLGSGTGRFGVWYCIGHN